MSERNLVSRMIKGDYIKYVLFFAVFYSTLFLWKNNFFSRYFTSQVKGLVKDISQDSPIEMVSVGDKDSSTFTNYRGEFVLGVSGRSSPQVKILTPKSYEPGNELMKCTSVGSSFLDKTFFCETFLYPQPFEIAARVLNDDKAVEFQNYKDRADHKKGLWNRSSKLSKEAFGTEGDFIFLLSKKEEIEIKLERQLIDFDVREVSTILREYSDPTMKKGISDVAEVQVVRYFADGSKSEMMEHFVKEDGIWRYLIPFTHKAVYDFVVNNEWLLKVKK